MNKDQLIKVLKTVTFDGISEEALQKVLGDEALSDTDLNGILDNVKKTVLTQTRAINMPSITPEIYRKAIKSLKEKNNHLGDKVSGSYDETEQGYKKLIDDIASANSAHIEAQKAAALGDTKKSVDELRAAIEKEVGAKYAEKDTQLAQLQGDYAAIQNRLKRDAVVSFVKSKLPKHHNLTDKVVERMIADKILEDFDIDNSSSEKYQVLEKGKGTPAIRNSTLLSIDDLITEYGKEAGLSTTPPAVTLTGTYGGNGVEIPNGVVIGGKTYANPFENL
jgi:hypothetical protein